MANIIQSTAAEWGGQLVAQLTSSARSFNIKGFPYELEVGKVYGFRFSSGASVEYVTATYTGLNQTNASFNNAVRGINMSSPLTKNGDDFAYVGSTGSVFEANSEVAITDYPLLGALIFAVNQLLTGEVAGGGITSVQTTGAISGSGLIDSPVALEVGDGIEIVSNQATVKLDGGSLTKSAAGLSVTTPFTAAINQEIQNNAASITSLETQVANNRASLAAIVQRVVINNVASADSVDKITLNNEEAFLTEQYVSHQATPPSVTFADFTDANFIGFYYSDPAISSFNVGQWYFNQVSHLPRVVTDTDPIAAGVQKGWIDAVITELIPGDERYIGEFANDAEAAPHVNGVRRSGSKGDIYFDTTNTSLREATARTAGTEPTYSYRLKKLLSNSDLNPIIDRIAALEAGGGGSSVEAGTRTTQVTGTANAGNSARYAREDHIHNLPLESGGLLAFTGTDQLGVDRTALQSWINANVSLGITQTAADARYLRQAQADARYLQESQADGLYFPLDTVAAGSGISTERSNPARISFLFPDGATKQISVLTPGSIRETFFVPDTITTSNRGTLSPVRIQLDGFIAGLTRANQLSGATLDGGSIRSSFTLAGGEFVGNGAFRLIFSLTNTQLHNLANASGNYVVLAVSYNVGSGAGTYTHTVPRMAGATVTPYINPEHVVGGVGSSTGGLTQSQVDGRVRALVANEAEQGNASVWGVAKLGTGTANSTKVLFGDGTWKDAPGGGLNQSQVDTRVRTLVADPAEQGNSSRWAPAKLGSGSASNSTVLFGDGAWRAPPSGGLNQNQVDARIATFARATPSGTIPIAQIPTTIARTSQLPSNATTTTAGLVEKATATEANAGTAADKYPDVPLVRGMIGTHGAVVQSVQILTALSSASFRVSEGTVGTLALTQNITLGMGGGADGLNALLRVTQDTTGNRTIAFRSSISGTAPTLSTGAGETDLLLFHRIGTQWTFINILNNV